MNSPDTRRRAAELVGRGFTHAEAGLAVGVSKKTVTRWLRDPDLRAVAEEEHREAIDPSAAGVLRGLLQSTNESIRLRAAALLVANPGVEAEILAALEDGPSTGPRITVVDAAHL